MNSRKGQIMGQIFIYILAIIIFSLILLYGYKTVKNFSKKADDVTLIQLTTDLKTSVKKIKGDYGTVRKKEVNIPGVYTYVCFIDLDYQADPFLQGEHPVVYNSWFDQAKSNMFLITTKEEIESYHIDGIKIGKEPTDPHYECIDVKHGEITLRLEGLGDSVELSEWPS